ncbi:MAG TPA: class I SAM-dependent methyltransferase [Planctomycetota bacterium]|nr:class I SAM-dependent methyltransferase [Planctomycetota bacterium]
MNDSQPIKPFARAFKKETLLRRINNRSVYRTIRRAIRESSVSSPVLLAPCGYGWFFEWYRTDKIPIIGVDIEGPKVVAAQMKLNPPVPIIKANILNLPFRDNQFEFVVSNRFLLHFNDDFRGKAFRELARVTGKYLLVHYDYATSIRQWLRSLRGKRSQEKDFSTKQGYRVWKRHGRKLHYNREMMAREGAEAGLRLKRLYFVSYLISERVYCLYEKA